MQQMISSGLYGTTTAAGAGRRWEEAVGAPARLRLEDIMMQRLSQAQVGKAGFMERIEEPYPDYAMMAGLMQQGAAGGGGYRPMPRQEATKTPSPWEAGYMGGGWTLGAGLGVRKGKETGYTYPSQPAYKTPTTPTTPSAGIYSQATAAAPTPQEVGMTGGMGALPGMKPPMTPREAMRKFSTYEEFSSWAKGRGLVSGSKREWAAVKKRVG